MATLTHTTLLLQLFFLQLSLSTELTAFEDDVHQLHSALKDILRTNEDMSNMYLTERQLAQEVGRCYQLVIRFGENELYSILCVFC